MRSQLKSFTKNERTIKNAFNLKWKKFAFNNNTKLTDNLDWLTNQYTGHTCHKNHETKETKMLKQTEKQMKIKWTEDISSDSKYTTV